MRQRHSFGKESGAIKKLNFLSQNPYTPLRDIHGGDGLNLGGKQKASSSLEDQLSPKKAQDVNPEATQTVSQSDEGHTNMVLDPPPNTTHELHEVVSDPVIYNGTQIDQTEGAPGQNEQTGNS